MAWCFGIKALCEALVFFGEECIIYTHFPKNPDPSLE